MVNRGARIVEEALGGQILVSARVWQEIQPELRALGRPHVRDLGEKSVLGLGAERLVEVLPSELAERLHVL